MERVFYNGRLVGVWVCADFDDLPLHILRYLALYNCETVGVVA
jgi:hypothetical protein